MYSRNKKIGLTQFGIFACISILFVMTLRVWVALILGTTLVIGLAIYEIYVVSKNPSAKFLSIQLTSYENIKKSVLYSIAGGIASATYISILLLASSYTSFEFVVHQDLRYVSLTLANIMIFASIPSLTEEVLFRHFCQGRFLNKFSKPVRVVIPTVLFVLLHIPAYSASVSGLLTIVAIFPTSIALALIYEQSESIILPILLHFINNALAVVFFAKFGYIF